MAGACEKAENTYSNLHAKFVMDQVLQVAPLRIACESKAEFCMVFLGQGTFVFQSFKDTKELPRTAIQDYQGCLMGLAGFLVGQPNIPDDSNPLVCYDAACPNCYADRSMTKRLKLTDTSMAQCEACQRIYNLDDHGYVFRGDEGKRLIRYRAVYSTATNTLVISN